MTWAIRERIAIGWIFARARTVAARYDAGGVRGAAGDPVRRTGGAIDEPRSGNCGGATHEQRRIVQGAARPHARRDGRLCRARRACPGSSRWSAGAARSHVDAIGTQAVGGSDPMRRDTIFRIASMTKPITAVGGDDPGRGVQAAARRAGRSAAARAGRPPGAEAARRRRSTTPCRRTGRSPCATC